MKKLLLALSVLASVAFSTQAQNYYVTNNLANSNHVARTQGHVIKEITLFSTNTTPTIVRLYDGALTYVTSAYTNYTTYVTNQITTYTNTGGTTNLFTNTVLYTAVSVNAAATNNRTPIATYVVPANNVSVTFEPNQRVVNYLTVSNTLTGLSFVYQYTD